MKWADGSTALSAEFDFFDLADIGMIVVDTTGHLRRANAAFSRIVGRPLDELIVGTAFSWFTDPADISDIEALLHRLLVKKNDQTIHIEKRYVRPTGAVVWVDLAIRPMFDTKGDITCFFSQVFDVTDRKLAEEASQRELHDLEEAQRVAQLGSFEQDPESGMVEISAELGRMLGIGSSGPITSARLVEAVHPADRERLVAGITACISDHTPVNQMHRLLLADGTLRWVHARGEWVEALHGGHDRIVGTVLDVTDRHAAEEALAFEGCHDALTGLANRPAFLEKVDSVLTSARYEAERVAVVLLDLDDFKSINDALGHSVGDELLVALSRRLVAATRVRDTIARVGGDEFAILVESAHSLRVAEQIGKRIAEVLKAPFLLGDHEAKVSASIGIAISGEDRDSGGLLRDADLAMYLAKKNGKDRLEIAEAGMQARALEHLVTLTDLHHAVEFNEFEVYYQAIVDTETSALAGAEALVRWNHPTRGLLPPGELIEIAESCGLIVPIGRRVRREACRQLAEWRGSGVVNDAFYISVNLSPRQLGEASLVDNVAKDLEDAGLPSRVLVLEITESTLMADFDADLSRLQELKATGLRFALDDYGTGYSSLARLSELPIDIVKIDKSFIDHLPSSDEGRALVKSVIDAARALHMKTVAEGVENLDQREVLVDLGCTYIQGYLFSSPLPADKTEEGFRSLSGTVNGLKA